MLNLRLLSTEHQRTSNTIISMATYSNILLHSLILWLFFFWRSFSYCLKSSPAPERGSGKHNVTAALKGCVYNRTNVQVQIPPVTTQVRVRCFSYSSSPWEGQPLAKAKGLRSNIKFASCMYLLLVGFEVNYIIAFKFFLSKAI